MPAGLAAELAETVTLGSYETHPGIEALAAVTKKFTANTGIKVKTNTVDHNTFQNQINSYLQGRPDDVFTWFAGYRMQFFAAKGLATPIDDVWKVLTSTSCRTRTTRGPSTTARASGRPRVTRSRRRGISSSPSPRRCRRTG
jgi:maltose-binding protein MalE